MNNKQIEDQIKSAFEHATPDVFADIANECEKESKYINSENELVVKKQKSVIHYKKLFSYTAIAILAVICILAAVLRYGATTTVAATIDLDVNPSIEITIDDDNKIIEVDALNDDAEEVIGDMDLEGVNLDVALNAILGSMVQLGYLSDIQNAILVSVDYGDDADSEDALQSSISEIINSILDGQIDTVSLLSQDISNNTLDKDTASQYKISIGKLALVNSIMEQTDIYTEDELAEMSISDLYAIIYNNSYAVTSLNESSASTSQTISNSDAVSIALTDIGYAESDMKYLNSWFEIKDDTMIYYVEFEINEQYGIQYTYEIDASSGDILNVSIENDDDDDSTGDNTSTDDSSSENSSNSATAESTTSYISEETAKSIVLEDAGVSESDADFNKYQYDDQDGTTCIEIEFTTENGEYQYLLNAYTGVIMESDNNIDDNDDHSDHNNDNYSNNNSTSYVEITDEQAVEIALSSAGISENQLRGMDVNLENKYSDPYYQIDFNTTKTNFSYQIDATDGSIISSQIK